MMTSKLVLALAYLVLVGEQSQPAPPMKIAEEIDAYVAEAARRDQVELPPLVDDDLFLRRVSLDLLGRIPSRDELLEFRRLPDRPQIVRQMLESQEHFEFWSRLWTNTFVGYVPTQQTDREVLRLWLEAALQQHQGYDQIVQALIGAKGRGAFEGPTNFFLRHGQDVVVPVGRIFLGVQLDCARCHDHPHDRWSQADFEGMQRFFELTYRRQASSGSYEVLERRPEHELPKFLTGARTRTRSWRSELAVLVTSSRPFRRATANRLWYHFFGQGLSEEVDNINGADRCPDFALAELLGNHLDQHEFDWRAILEGICLSQSYQRESNTKKAWPLLPSPKPLSPDQLFESIEMLVGEDAEPSRMNFFRSATGVSVTDSFSNSWDLHDPAQALMARMQLPLPKQPHSTTALFETYLSRLPTEQQRRTCHGQRAEDIAFALMHSSEFLLWH